ncbi:MAG: Elongation factor 4 [Candidatus Giovannonibacteria bacterium GW2011_GWA1_43_15]|nr:MAG: Elongation factor 4 [Candidatus Giovannonibacteria bacterium GW2011_GWB1_43_13]KKS99394.1 MAG: Elongation factor 4 [Candidatus Giovannonibacteria bacterium GW2011_GWA1_43_15]KKT21772.1 MAG: Elongation factor 4 [Candidatus Giovannonibacteria bacterium GW2011_GWC2_43_8]KKT62931.1 MAG: Elongation factor 4 [Candidatus Giovannonibacteria bacterium GW2011_GWA2_44_26]
MLEITGTVEKRKMREQFLDMHPLERERGITIKMQPVRMHYKNYVLNLIDTPGHIDFNYEVSRALAAVEGAILLVDATQGVEAQTISNIELARSLNLKIIPIVNKIDLAQARISETKEEIVNLLGCGEEEILEVSAKTGDGVENLLEEVVRRVPSPHSSTLGVEAPKTPSVFPRGDVRALIFDFEYSIHRGVIAHARIFDGEIKKGLKLKLAEAKEIFTVGEVGIFKPELGVRDMLEAGEIGYIVTGIKEAKIVRVGDTILKESSNIAPLAGYKEIKPVVFSSIYPEDQDRFEDLRRALERLKLVDSALFFEEESSGVLGRGFRCGFLGMLHLEIVVERLIRDFGVKVIAATPTVKYRVKTKQGEAEVYSPHKFPDEHEILEILEPYIKIEILAPPEKLSGILKLLGEHEVKIFFTTKFSESRIKIDGEMPLRELMRDFFDALKSVSQGYASLGYEFLDLRQADLVRLDVLVAEEIVPAFSRIVSHARLEHEAEAAVEKLYNILPRALFSLKIQAKAHGRILASRSLKAMSKDVTGHLYGGDRSRKMKLWKKQKEGKKRLGVRADYNIPPEVYLKMIRK